METNREKPIGIDGTPYIWLRYTTQFTTGGRTHTIEMGIPVPIGASQETREQLIREAEAGMAQLSQRVEGRVSQMMQRNPPAASQTPRSEEPARHQTPSPASPGSVRPTGPVSTPAGSPPQPHPQPTPQAERQPIPQAVPQTRPVGVTMPSSPAGENAGSMKLSQFLQIIRDRWSMTPKEAMDLLEVRNLNGLNYRDALRKLQVAREGAPSSGKPTQQIPATGPASPARPANTPTPLRNTASQAAPPARPDTPAPSPAKPTQAAPANQPAARPVPASNTPAPPTRVAPGPTPLGSSATAPKAQSTASGPSALPPPPSPIRRADTDEVGGSPKAPIPIQTGTVRTLSRPYKFDEEEDEQDEEMDVPDDDEKDFQRITAQSKLDELKDIRGNTSATAARLTVLRNVLNSQISDAQLQKIIQAAWGAASEKKLKVDQVEALISWAKEDFFVEEAEAVLALIDEEDAYARSDW